MIKSRATKSVSICCVALLAGILTMVPSLPTSASTITLNALNSFSYEVELGATISQPGIGAGTSAPGQGPILGTGLVFSIGTPDVANLSITDNILGRDLSNGGTFVRPRNVIGGDIQLTVLVLSSGNLYHLDMLSWLLDRGGCVGQCATLESNTSFNIERALVPIPAALPLFAAGLGAMGFMGWRRRRRAA